MRVYEQLGRPGHKLSNPSKVTPALISGLAAAAAAAAANAAPQQVAASKSQQAVKLFAIGWLIVLCVLNNRLSAVAKVT